MATNMLSERESCVILGVTEEATAEEIIAARRRLARVAHPDSGGSHGEMVAINEACRVLLAARAKDGSGSGSSASHPTDPHTSVAGDVRHDGRDKDVRDNDVRDNDVRDNERRRYGFRDAPSFVISALPVEAFETLLIAAAHLGEIVDEDPPYLLEVLVRDPGPLWCRFELFPDAGSTTVILSCDVEVGYRVYSVEEIRDLWISTINASSIPE